jgi:hypothetical protein
MKLVTLIGKAGRLLKSIKGLLALAAVGFGGTFVGKMILEGNTKSSAFWPGVTDPTGKPLQST